jgi:hypothetical protein
MEEEMTMWHLMTEECPFKTDECKTRPVHDYDIIDGAFVIKDVDPNKYWCNGPTCAIAAIGRSVSPGELWKAYQDHRIRFMVDGKGNPVIKIERTGEVVRSRDFTTEHLERARFDPPSTRDHTGRLKSGVARRRLVH